ncbi:TMV resistance protein N-like [Senna tora]|uniref:TMV resistance protein N-like n=1 Tax=Senna tora TaxID=362788 RepID=A0A834W8K7_9FABA|nr:TMV resistance protein N-like [Senna tora]
MDEQQVMQLTSFSLMQAIQRNSSDPEHEATYPTSSIPWWFTYRVTADNPFIIQLAPPSDSDDHLLGFVLCGILPRLADRCRICFYLLSEDGYCGYSNRVFGLSDSNRDLAFMWFAPFKKILGKSEGYNICCKYICEASGQAVPGAACGVCPIYSSQIKKIIENLLESNTCHEDHIEDDKPEEIEIQPHFHINRDNQINPPPLAKEIDKEDQRKGLQLFLFSCYCGPPYLNVFSALSDMHKLLIGLDF